MKGRVFQLGNLAFWVLVLLAGARYFVPTWKQFDVSSDLARVRLPWILGALSLLSLQYLANYGLWLRVLEILGGHVPTGKLFPAFGLSLLPKYIPGKLFGVGVRARLATTAGISNQVAVGSLAWEIGLSLASAIAITGVGYAVGVSNDLGPLDQVLTTTACICGAALLVSTSIPRVRSLLVTWLHPRALSRWPWRVAIVFMGYIGSWLIATAAHWMLARSLGPFALKHAIPLLVALAGSWAVGMLSVLAPGGLGVREGLLFLFARHELGAPAALLFVTLSRLLIFAVEVGLTLVAWCSAPSRPSAVTSTDASR